MKSSNTAPIQVADPVAANTTVTSTPKQPKHNFSLVDLLRELRDLIYGFCFCFPSTMDITQAMHYVPSTSLPLVSRSINAETERYHYGTYRHF